jgi:hypothetical protein
MDRMIVPNGAQPEHEYARKWFTEFCSQEQIILVYVTGLHRQLVQKAISDFSLPVLESPIPSVLVANAAPEIREIALRQAEVNGNAKSLYLATGKGSSVNGNYSAGVLEGVYHFLPGLRKRLQQAGFRRES